MRFNILFQIQQVRAQICTANCGCILTAFSLESWLVLPLHPLAICPANFHCYRLDRKCQDPLPLQRSFQWFGLRSWLSLEVEAWRTFLAVVWCHSSVWVSVTQVSLGWKFYELWYMNFLLYANIRGPMHTPFTKMTLNKTLNANKNKQAKVDIPSDFRKILYSIK